ncbi:acyltransferase [Yoonia sp. SDW83-1]|uniref:acyltransferase n=1 Tax=Yoonia sp. SDW83-1 TaxID=3366945 RepID=UPI00398C3819
MARNFNDEAILNLLFRAMRAAIGRLRGRLFYLFGFFSSGTANSLYFGFSPRIMNSRGILLGRNVSFGILARLECHGRRQTGPLIKIGDRSSFGDYTHIGATEGIIIGSGVLGGSGILIVDHSHGTPKADMATKTHIAPRDRPLSSKGPIKIGDNVWIGDQAVILGGVTIGAGAIISAGAVVDRDVAPHSIHFRAEKGGEAK